MESDESNGESGAEKPSSNRRFIIIAVVMGFFALGIVGTIIYTFTSPMTPFNYFLRIITSVGGGFLIAFILVGITFSYLTRRQDTNGCCGLNRLGLWYEWMASAPLDGGVSNLHSFSQRRDPGAKAFTYEELMEATDGFSASNLLGKGGFGKVYRGTIAGNLQVAVKQLNIGGSQGEREFRAEVATISRVHHRHLVSMVGHCISNDERLLVYKYVPNGTLYDALHGQGKPVLDWATRMNIALGTARGLVYLHEDCHPRIIHRDIKGSNILISAGWEALVGDFGLAKLFHDGKTHVSTHVMGTFGYLAPEYAMSGNLTDKSDVYSFGVVLLELITGKEPLFDEEGEQVSLVQWARPLLAQAVHTQNLSALADLRLMDHYNRPEMFRMILVAANCVRRSAQKRPKMTVALRALDAQDGAMDQGVKPGYSREHAGAHHTTSFSGSVDSNEMSDLSSDYKLDV